METPVGGVKRRLKYTVSEGKKKQKRMSRTVSMNKASKRPKYGASSRYANKVITARDVQDPPVIPMPRQIATLAPEYFNIELNYGEMGELIYFTSPATLSGTYRYRLDGLNDPNYTSTGHQPQGFDVWKTIYKYYRVTKCEVYCELYNITSSTAGPANLSLLAVCGFQSEDQTGYENFDNSALLEAKGTTQYTLFGNNTTYGNSGFTNSAVFTDTFTPESFGISVRDDVNAGTIWTPVGSDPADNKYFVIHCRTFYSTSVTFYVFMKVRLKYTVQFRELVDNYSTAD